MIISIILTPEEIRETYGFSEDKYPVRIRIDTDINNIMVSRGDAPIGRGDE